MTPSQTTSRKTCKLSMICINLFSNNKDGCGGKTKCAIAKKTKLESTWFLLSEKGVKPDLNYPVKSRKFLMRYRLRPLISLLMHTKKNIIYALIMHHRIVYRETGQPILLRDIRRAKICTYKYICIIQLMMQLHISMEMCFLWFQLENEKQLSFWIQYVG